MGTLKLQLLDKRFQIISSIDRAARNGGDIWQKDEEEKQTLEIIDVEIDLINQNFSLKLRNFPKINQDLPLHFRFYYRNLLFHLNPLDYKFQDEKLVCRFPGQAMALEKRLNDRFAFRQEAEVFLTIIKINEKHEVDIIVARIVDVSQNGFGVLIPNSWKDRLQENDHLRIKAIDQHLLHQDIFGKLTYIRSQDSADNFRSGISLEVPLGKENFEYLKRRSFFVLTG